VFNQGFESMFLSHFHQILFHNSKIVSVIAVEEAKSVELIGHLVSSSTTIQSAFNFPAVLKPKQSFPEKCDGFGE